MGNIDCFLQVKSIIYVILELHMNYVYSPDRVVVTSYLLNEQIQDKSEGNCTNVSEIQSELV